MDSIPTMALSRLADLRAVFTGFAVEAVLGGMIFLHYRRFGTALSSQHSFGPVIPFVALTTFLVISVIKSSFALSLGLVGALSIVRFRTPVKDPDELAYIFLAIASGIGVAAGQLTVTATVVPLILVVATVVRRTLRTASEGVFLAVDVPGVTDAEAAFATVRSVVRANSAGAAILRYEMHDDVLHVTAEAELTEPEAMARITNQLRRAYPSTSVSFHDESRTPAA